MKDLYTLAFNWSTISDEEVDFFKDEFFKQFPFLERQLLHISRGYWTINHPKPPFLTIKLKNNETIYYIYPNNEIKFIKEIISPVRVVR